MDLKHRWLSSQLQGLSVSLGLTGSSFSQKTGQNCTSATFTCTAIIQLQADQSSMQWIPKVMMMMMLSIQLSLTLDSMFQVSLHLLNLHYFLRGFLCSGVSFDSIQPLFSLMSWFPFKTNSSKHNCFLQ